jgi:FtsZ-interacting cell division protein ZipA
LNDTSKEKESAVDSTVIILVVVIVVLVLALIAAGVMLNQRRRSERLQEHYGAEYERSVDQAGNRRAAEAELARREKRHRDLDIRDLRSEERDRFANSWAGIQRELVDDPKRAVRDADVLVVEIMRTRGYPVDDFDRRAEEISVAHPDVVQRYREANAVRDATESGAVDTEQQRSALTSYRSLIDALLTGDHSTSNATRNANSHTNGKERTR